MTSLVDKLVPDDLWALVEPCCHPNPTHPTAAGTAPSVTAAASPRWCSWPSPPPWALLPAMELGCGSASTAWRRLDQWATAGVFDQLHLEVLDRLGLAGRLDWSRASVDSASVRAK
jgi:transposase